MDILQLRFRNLLSFRLEIGDLAGDELQRPGRAREFENERPMRVFSASPVPAQ